MSYYRAARLVDLLDAEETLAEDSVKIGLIGRTISVPTLVLWGEHEPFLHPNNLDGLDQLVPRLTIRRIPGGHRIIHSHPALVNVAIRSFIEAM